MFYLNWEKKLFFPFHFATECFNKTEIYSLFPYSKAKFSVPFMLVVTIETNQEWISS